MKVTNVRLPTQIDDHYLKRIGEIAAYFGLLEFLLGEFTRALLGTKRGVTQIITGKLRFAELVDLFEDLYRHSHHGHQSLKNLENFVKQAKQVGQERNGILHSLWSPTGSPGLITAMRLTRGRRPTFKSFSINMNDLESICNAIKKTIGDLSALFGPGTDSQT